METTIDPMNTSFKPAEMLAVIKSPFAEQLGIGFSFNGKEMSRGMYNLLVTRRDMKMYSRHNMKPHRFWKFGDVKTYFGLSGGKDKVCQQIEELIAIMDSGKHNEIIEALVSRCKPKLNLDKN
jgi:hypothetical protein